MSAANAVAANDGVPLYGFSLMAIPEDGAGAEPRLEAAPLGATVEVFGGARAR